MRAGAMVVFFGGTENESALQGVILGSISI